MKSDRRPPLAKSPMRLRTRRVLKPTNTNTPLRTPIGLCKAQMKESEVRPACNTISCDLKALAKMVQDELGAMGAKAPVLGNNSSINNSILGSLSPFERGRFYDEYSARRNERLMKKQSDGNDEPKSAYSLGVKVESAKKKDSKKKAEILKKSVAVTYSVDRTQHPRYALRSTAKKPPLPVPMNVVEEKTTARKTAAGSKTRRY